MSLLTQGITIIKRCKHDLDSASSSALSDYRNAPFKAVNFTSGGIDYSFQPVLKGFKTSIVELKGSLVFIGIDLFKSLEFTVEGQKDIPSNLLSEILKSLNIRYISSGLSIYNALGFPTTKVRYFPMLVFRLCTDGYIDVLDNYFNDISSDIVKGKQEDFLLADFKSLTYSDKNLGNLYNLPYWFAPSSVRWVDYYYTFTLEGKKYEGKFF